MYCLGEGVECDVDKGIKLMVQAADFGSSDAQELCGDVFLKGMWGAIRNPRRAIYYYLRSLQNRNRRAAIALASVLEERPRAACADLRAALRVLAREDGVTTESSQLLVKQKRKHK
jgi:TPR repeat protein